MNIKLKRIICFVLCALLIVPTFTYAQQKEDYVGHWAEKEIKTWISKGVLTGLSDGSIRPNKEITRAEFMAIVNRVFGFTDKADINYSDVKSGDWFYNDVAIAVKAGYIGGFSDGTMKPKANISRQEVAVILARVLKLDTTNKTGLNITFADKKDIPQWSLSSVAAVVNKGFMNGAQKGEAKVFNPLKSITRAEVFVLLDRSYLDYTKVTYTKPGTYKADIVDGSVRIDSKDVTLQDTVINGDLIIGAAVGDGNVYLKNVTVKGDTLVNGGGMNSIILEDCQFVKVIVNKADGKIRILAKGKTKVQSTELQSGAKLESNTSSTDTGFTEVIVDQVIEANSIIQLVGNFNNVEIEGGSVNLKHSGGTIKNLTVKEDASQSTVSLDATSKVNNLKVDAAATITGSGKIDNANVNVPGVKITATVTTVVKPQGVTVEVTAPSTSGGTTGGTSSGGSGSGGSGGGGDDDDDNPPPAENAALDNWISNLKVMILGYSIVSGNFDVELNGATTTITIKEAAKTRELNDLLMSAVEKITSRAYDTKVQSAEKMLADNISSIKIGSDALNTYIANKLHGKQHSVAAENYFRNLGTEAGAQARYEALQNALKTQDSYTELSSTLKEIVSFDTNIYVPKAVVKGLTLDSVIITKGDGKAVTIEAGKSVSINTIKTSLGITSKVTLGSLQGSKIEVIFKGTSTHKYTFNLGN